MPTTVVSVAFAAFLAAALLGREFDRRSVAVVLLAAALPDLDVLAAYAWPGLHNALLHSLLWPALAGALLYYDLRVRRRSWLRARWGRRGVRVAWVGVLAFAVAGVGPDLLNVEGAAALWPLDDTVYKLIGRAEVTNTEGFLQTFLEVSLDGEGPVVSVEYYPPGYEPALPYDPENGSFVLTLVQSGWQLLVVLAAPIVLALRARRERVDEALERAAPAGQPPARGQGPDRPTEE